MVYRADFDSVWVADPAIGRVVYSVEEFLEGWEKKDTEEPKTGVVLLFETTSEFQRQKRVENPQKD